MQTPLLICWITLTTTAYRVQGSGSTFRERAITAIELVQNNLHIQKCIQAAREKASEYYDTTNDHHYAVLWISMYSRECIIPDSLLKQDKENRFPFRLNKELRCRYDTKKDKTFTSIFIQVGNIIEESLKMFPQYQPQNAYRGVSLTWPYIDQTFFVEEGFFSVSKGVSPALNFGPSEKMFLLIVKNYTGASIEQYVEEKFKYQKEVLGETGKMFQIESKVTNKTEIKNIMSTFNVHPKHEDHTPAAIIYMRQIIGNNKEQVLQQQRKMSESYCSSSHESSGQFQVKCNFFTLLVHFLLLGYFKEKLVNA